MSSDLSPSQLWTIFQQRIVPNEFSGLLQRSSPAVVFVGGPPGSGTDVLVGKAEQEILGYTKSAPAVVTAARLESYHPDYFGPTPSGRDIGLNVQEAGYLWAAMATDAVVRAGVDAVIELPMGDPETAAAAVFVALNAGYHVTARLTSMPDVVSRLGVFAEFAQQVKHVGCGRVVDQADHDRSFRGLLEFAQIVDEQHLAHQAQVYGRGGLVAFNHLQGGAWRYSDTSIAQAVSRERERPWSPAERQQFDALAQRLMFALGDRWHPELKAIVDQASAGARPGSAQAFPPIRPVRAEQVGAATTSSRVAAAASVQARHRR